MLAAALGQLGCWTGDRGEFDQAKTYFTEGLAAAELGGDPWITASVLFDRSNLERLRGMYNTARAYWCQAFELAVGFRSPGVLLEGMGHLVNILVDSAENLELAYELACFVTEHPSTIEGIKKTSAAIVEQIAEQLPEGARQAAIARPIPRPGCVLRPAALRMRNMK